MNCPECGGKTKKYKHLKDGACAYRQLKCTECGNLFHTVVDGSGEVGCSKEEFLKRQNAKFREWYRRKTAGVHQDKTSAPTTEGKEKYGVWRVLNEFVSLSGTKYKDCECTYCGSNKTFPVGEEDPYCSQCGAEMKGREMRNCIHQGFAYAKDGYKKVIICCDWDGEVHKKEYCSKCKYYTPTPQTQKKEGVVK